MCMSMYSKCNSNINIKNNSIQTTRENAVLFLCNIHGEAINQKPDVIKQNFENYSSPVK